MRTHEFPKYLDICRTSVICYLPHKIYSVKQRLSHASRRLHFLQKVLSRLGRRRKYLKYVVWFLTRINETSENPAACKGMIFILSLSQDKAHSTKPLSVMSTSLRIIYFTRTASIVFPSLSTISSQTMTPRSFISEDIRPLLWQGGLILDGFFQFISFAPAR